MESGQSGFGGGDFHCAWVVSRWYWIVDLENGELREWSNLEQNGVLLCESILDGSESADVLHMDA